MKLKRISATNFQGRTFSFDLDDITIFVGPPMRGKTAVKNAVTFLLLGYVPKLGKLASASADLASAFPMSVVGVCDDGSIISRGLERKGKSVSMTVSDNMPAVPPVLLSPGVFFDMGPTERTKFIFSRVQLDEKSFSTGSIVDSIAAVTLPAQDDEHKAALEEIVSEVRNASEVHNAQSENEDPTTPTVQDWLELQIQFVKEKLKEWKAAAKRYVGHEQTSEELNARHGETFSRSAGEIEGDIQTLSTELNGVNQRCGEINSARSAQKQWRDQRASFTATANNPQNAELAKQLAEVELKRNGLQETVQAYQSQTIIHRGKKQELVGEVNRMEARVSEINRESQQPSNQLTAEGVAKGNSLKRERDKEDSDLKSLTATFEKNKACPSCPVCATAGTEFVDKIKSLFENQKTRHESNIARLDAEIEETKVAVQTERNRLAKLLGEEKANLTIQIDNKKKEIAVVDAQLADSQKADEASVQDRKAITALNLQVNSLRGAIEDYQKAKNALETMSPEDTADYSVELGQVEARIPTISVDLAKLRQELRDLGAAEAAAQRRAQAEQERLRANASVAVCDLIADKLADIQQKAISASMSPIIDTANAFTLGLLKTPIELVDCEFGRRENGVWISHKVFSGTEELLAFAGISVALTVGKSPFRIPMMDELGRMDNETKIKVTNRIAELIKAGIIEQFIGIDVVPVPYNQIPGTKVINV